MHHFSKLLRAGLLLAALLVALPGAVAQTMKVGTNFWDISWGGSDPFVSGYTNVSGTNPWRQDFLNDVAGYTGPLRFMDFGKVNNAEENHNGLWVNRKQKSALNQKPMAYEWMIDLCNRTGRDLWVCLPHNANEDYMLNLARLIKNNLNPGLKCYVEWSNEVWNGQFTQFGYAASRGKALGFATDDYTASGFYNVYISTKMFKIFQDEFAGQTGRLVKVISGQSLTEWINTKIIEGLKRPDVNTTGVMPDQFAGTAYIGGINGTSATLETEWAAEVKKMTDFYVWLKGALAGTNIGMITYEGGHHITTNADQFSANPKSYQLYRDLLTAMQSHVTLFMHYVHSGAWGTVNAWGAKRFIDQPLADAHKYRALVDYMKATTPPPVTLRTPENPASTTAGVEYKYYEGTWSVLPNFDALTAVKSGNVANFDMSVRNRVDNYGFKYAGFVNVPTDGTYTFYTSSDDGSKLYIGTTEVVNNDGLHGLQERSGTIGLKAGKHAISVTFFEAGGGEGLTVSYSGPALTKQTIPNAALFRTSGTTTPAPTTTTLTPVADTDTQSDVAAGTNATLNASKWNTLYVKFNLSALSGTVSAAKLRVYRNATTAGTLNVSGASPDAWTEGGAKPTLGGLITTATMGTTAGYIEIDVTNTVKAEAAGDDLVTFGLTTSLDTWSAFHSRENASNKPQLVVTYTAGARQSFELADAGQAIRLHPNPVSGGAAYLQLEGRAGEAVRITLTNPAQQPVAVLDKTLHAGTNLIRLPTAGLRKGLYLTTVQQGTQRTVRKLVVQ